MRTARGWTWSTSSPTSTQPSTTSRSHRWSNTRLSGYNPRVVTFEGVFDMPQEAWGSKRERQYEHIKESAKKQGKSTKRAKEIAARTVNKERARSGETKGRPSKTSTRDISSGRRGGACPRNQPAKGPPQEQL